MKGTELENSSQLFHWPRALTPPISAKRTATPSRIHFMWAAASSCHRLTSSSPAGAVPRGARRSDSARLPHKRAKSTTLKVAAEARLDGDCLGPDRAEANRLEPQEIGVEGRDVLNGRDQHDQHDDADDQCPPETAAAYRESGAVCQTMLAWATRSLPRPQLAGGQPGDFQVSLFARWPRSGKMPHPSWRSVPAGPAPKRTCTPDGRAGRAGP